MQITLRGASRHTRHSFGSRFFSIAATAKGSAISSFSAAIRPLGRPHYSVPFRRQFLRGKSRVSLVAVRIFTIQFVRASSMRPSGSIYIHLDFEPNNAMESGAARPVGVAGCGPKPSTKVTGCTDFLRIPMRRARHRPTERCTKAGTCTAFCCKCQQYTKGYRLCPASTLNLPSKRLECTQSPA